MLTKNSLSSSEDSTHAFHAPKRAVVTAPVLALPNFTKKFVIETDASGKDIGAFLMQDQRLIAYISKSLGPKQQTMSIYELELLPSSNCVCYPKMEQLPYSWSLHY